MNFHGQSPTTELAGGAAVTQFILRQVHHECDAAGCTGDEFTMGTFESMEIAKAVAVEDAGKPIEWGDKGSQAVGSPGWDDAEPPFWEYFIEPTETEKL